MNLDLWEGIRNICLFILWFLQNLRCYLPFPSKARRLLLELKLKLSKKKKNLNLF